MHRFAENTPDSTLAEAISTSDATAFKTLYYRYYEQLYTFLWRRIQNEETSKDLTQELFVRLWKNREKLDAGQSINAYLYKIANNLVIDHLRKKSVEQTYFADDFANEVPVYRANDNFELRERIEVAIEGLQEPVRSVFQMSRFEGLKYSEIAETLDISVKTVEARMSKALAILREKLKQWQSE